MVNQLRTISTSEEEEFVDAAEQELREMLDRDETPDSYMRLIDRLCHRFLIYGLAQ